MDTDQQNLEIDSELRDRFAMNALSSHPRNAYEYKEIAEWAYRVADAMMEERKP